jgi:hypothetical protein
MRHPCWPPFLKKSVQPKQCRLGWRPPSFGRVRLTTRLFAFNIFRFWDISGGQFSQRYFRFVITNIGVPLTFGRLISQIEGAWGHRRPFSRSATLPYRPK